MAGERVMDISVPYGNVFDNLVRRHLALVCPAAVPEIDLPGGMGKIIRVVDKLQEGGKMPGPLELRQISEEIMNLPEREREAAVDRHIDSWENRRTIGA